MFEDIEFFRGEGIERRIYAGSLTSNKLYVLNENNYPEFVMDNPPNVSLINWGVNKYNALLLAVEDNGVRTLRLYQPGKEVRTVQILESTDTVPAIAAQANGDFYYIVSNAVAQILYQLPSGANSPQMISNLSIIIVDYGATSKLWSLNHRDTNILYLTDMTYKLYRSADKGNSFQEVLNLGANPITDLICYRDRIYLATSYGVMMSSDGVNFNTVSYFGAINAPALASDNRGRVYVLSNAQLYFSDDGDTWQTGYSFGGSPDAIDIASDHNGRLYILRTGEGLAISDDGGFNVFTLLPLLASCETLKIVEWK